MLCCVGWLVELQSGIDYVRYDYASLVLPHRFELERKVTYAMLCWLVGWLNYKVPLTTFAMTMPPLGSFFFNSPLF